jgi:cysteine desulfurase
LTTGLGAACRRAADLSEMPRITTLRDRFWTGLQDRFGAGVVLNGHPDLRLPNTLNCSFIGAQGGQILAELVGVAASAGSACHSGQSAPSPVLQAMGIPDPIARGAIRFSLGRETTAEEIDAVVQRLPTRL